MPADDILLDFEESLEKAVDHLKHELRGIRTGRRSSSVREVRCPHDRHRTRCKLPCSSVTSDAPAAWCRPSTFWVMLPVSSPRRLSSATAR